MNWKTTQDAIIRQILAEMGRLRMTSKAMCEASGLCAAHWSEMKNLKKPISLEKLCAICDALKIKVRIDMPV